MTANGSAPSDTIFATSTGAGKCAVAIVRVSGPHCAQILEKIARRDHVIKDRVATLTAIFDAEQLLLDTGIVIRFFAPRSFTGEDMIEFQVTGSRAVLSGLLRTLGTFEGVRPAGAGEFARRAFENGKLDLVEVEGLAAVVEAETRVQLRHAQAMSSGLLSRECENVRSLLLRAIAQIGALLGFSDVEDATDISISSILSTVTHARSVLTNLLESSHVSERLRDGLTVAIAGPTNVGKSTLLNYLAKRDVAIVSAVAGTTRDTLEVAVELSGLPLTFIDTAGIRETLDPIEREGIARAYKRATEADLVLWLFDGDGSSPPQFLGSTPMLRVRTKADLNNVEHQEAEAVISVFTGLGIEDLIARVEDFARTYFDGAGRAVFGTERQRIAVRDVCSALARVLEDPRRGTETIAEDLRLALRALGRLTGRIGVEEMLGEIFSRLCVGK